MGLAVVWLIHTTYYDHTTTVYVTPSIYPLPFFSFFTIVIVYIMVTITTLTPFVCIVANSGFPYYLSSTLTNLVCRGPHIAYD